MFITNKKDTLLFIYKNSVYLYKNNELKDYSSIINKDNESSSAENNNNFELIKCEIFSKKLKCLFSYLNYNNKLLLKIFTYHDNKSFELESTKQLTINNVSLINFKYNEIYITKTNVVIIQNKDVYFDLIYLESNINKYNINILPDKYSKFKILLNQEKDELYLFYNTKDNSQLYEINVVKISVFNNDIQIIKEEKIKKYPLDIDNALMVLDKDLDYVWYLDLSTLNLFKMSTISLRIDDFKFIIANNITDKDNSFIGRSNSGFYYKIGNYYGYFNSLEKYSWINEIQFSIDYSCLLTKNTNLIKEDKDLEGNKFNLHNILRNITRYINLKLHDFSKNENKQIANNEIKKHDRYSYLIIQSNGYLDIVSYATGNKIKRM